MKSLLRNLSRCLEERRQNIQEKIRKKTHLATLPNLAAALFLTLPQKGYFNNSSRSELSATLCKEII